jgi:exopolysaccharide production protein ExoF
MRMHKRRLYAMALLCLLLGAGAVRPALAAPYSLGVGDEIRLKVYEWRSAVGDVHEWTALNGKFSVGAGGEVSLPLIGAVPAAGRTTDQLAQTIASRLKDAVGLASPPQASVEITKYRPFYILGSVAKPGEYPYRPGVNVLQAVSIAGGLFRGGDEMGSHSALSTAGDLRVLQLEYAGLLARRARLQAERDGSDKIAFPPELQQPGNPRIVQLVAQEQAMFNARRDALRSETDAVNKLKDLLNGEIASLGAKIKTVDQEIELLKQELANISSLVQRGLAAAPREFTLRQTELQTEGKRLDLDTAMLRAREDLGKADQALVELNNKRSAETLTELAQVDSKLSQTAARIKTSQSLLAQDGADPAALGEDVGPPVYTIIRHGDGGMQRVAATEASAVEPGDTIEVKRSGAPASLLGVADGAPGPAPKHDETAAAATPPKPAAAAPILVAPPVRATSGSTQGAAGAVEAVATAPAAHPHPAAAHARPLHRGRAPNHAPNHATGRDTR